MQLGGSGTNGLGWANGSGESATGPAADGGGSSPTDEVINSALRYRVQAPMIDSLLADIGIDGANIAKQGGLIREASDMQRISNEAARTQTKSSDRPKSGDKPAEKK
ncbi:MAG: flotillin domain-containing protein, partial [Pseudomonadota bacterium]